MNFNKLAQTLAATATLLIAQPIQAETFYFHNDHLGTPQALTDDSGTVVWQGNYSPFGEVNEATATVEQNIRFPGQYFEEETGLNYNYFRDYDPTTGRYIESDPIGLDGGINTFGYVGGSPILNIDVVGLAIHGTLFDSKVLPHEIDVTVLKGGWGLGWDTDGAPGLGPQVYSWSMLVGGNVRALIKCWETDDCSHETVREGYVEHSVSVPKVVPYTHKLEVSPVSWMYAVPYSLARLAIGVDPWLKRQAKLNGLPIPLICNSGGWMNDIPYAWSSEIGVGP